MVASDRRVVREVAELRTARYPGRRRAVLVWIGDAPDLPLNVAHLPEAYFSGTFTPAVNADSCSTTDVSFVPAGTS